MTCRVDPVDSSIFAVETVAGHDEAGIGMLRGYETGGGNEQAVVLEWHESAGDADEWRGVGYADFGPDAGAGVRIGRKIEIETVRDHRHLAGRVSQLDVRVSR